MGRSIAKQMFWASHERVYGFMREFHEIMSGDNPLTQEEIRAMVDKDPRYEFMRAWLKDEHP